MKVLITNPHYRAVFGTFLIFYAMFLTPAYFEPMDLVISTGWLALATEIGLPTILVILWMASGYIALILGAIFVGHYILKKFGVIGQMVVHHPMGLIIIVVAISFLVSYYFLYGGAL